MFPQKNLSVVPLSLNKKYFFPLCSQYPYYKNLPSSKPINLPVAHRVVSEVLALPFYGKLSKNDVEKIIKLIENILNY